MRRKIREEKEAEGGGPQANSRLEESTDSHFTIIYEGVPGLPEQYTEVERVWLDADTSQDSVSQGRSNNKKEIFGGKTDTSQDSVSPGGATMRRKFLKGRLHDCLRNRDSGGNHLPGSRRNNGGRTG